MKNTVLSEIKVSYTTNNQEKIKVSNSETAFKLFNSNWNRSTLELQEEFKILLLNRASKVLGIYPVSKGGVSGTLVDAKLVFSVALKCNASAIILAHNHPSGNLNPSESDKSLTKKLESAAKLLDIRVIDHIIITRLDYFSFADEGLISR